MHSSLSTAEFKTRGSLLLWQGSGMTIIVFPESMAPFSFHVVASLWYNRDTMGRTYHICVSRYPHGVFVTQVHGHIHRCLENNNNNNR